MAERCITVWHYDGKDYHKTVYTGVHVRVIEATLKHGIHQNGFTGGSKVTARIYTPARPEIACGDRLYPGIGGAEPDFCTDFKVTEIRDNRVGSERVKHVLIIAER